MNVCVSLCLAACVCLCCQQPSQRMCVVWRVGQTSDANCVCLLSYLSGSLPAWHPNAPPPDPIRQPECSSRAAACADYCWHGIV